MEYWGFGERGNTERTGEPFIDCAAIMWDPYKKDQAPDSEFHQGSGNPNDYPFWANQFVLSFDQLINDWDNNTMIDNPTYDKIIMGYGSNISINGKSNGQFYTWGLDSASTSDPSRHEKTKVFKIPPEGFDQDGKLLPEYRYVPLYYSWRWWDTSTSNYSVYTALEQGLYLDIISGEFKYVPWAIVTGLLPSLDMHNFGVETPFWESCNRYPGEWTEPSGTASGLYSKTSSGWDLIYCSPINPNVPGDSNGFRVKPNSWVVSPITPES
jgi:hypothetical protein